MAAEVVVLGYCEKECASTDLYHARRIAGSICLGDVETFLDREFQQTIALLESHRDVLLVLAAEIVSKCYLDGNEVTRVFRRFGRQS